MTMATVSRTDEVSTRAFSHESMVKLNVEGE